MTTLLEAPAVAATVLTVLDQLPDGCFAFDPTDRHAEPIVRLGEGAVIDPNDKEMVVGAHYLRRLDSQPGRFMIVELVDSPARASRGKLVYLARPHRPRTAENWAAWMAAGECLPMADGPFESDAQSRSGVYLASLIVGKVIGVCSPDYAVAQSPVTPKRWKSRATVRVRSGASFKRRSCSDEAERGRPVAIQTRAVTLAKTPWPRLLASVIGEDGARELARRLGGTSCLCPPDDRRVPSPERRPGRADRRETGRDLRGKPGQRPQASRKTGEGARPAPCGGIDCCGHCGRNRVFRAPCLSPPERIRVSATPILFDKIDSSLTLCQGDHDNVAAVIRVVEHSSTCVLSGFF